MSGIGLASYRSPEQASAAKFDTAARAVTAPAPSAGIGMATVPAPPQAPVTPEMAPAPAAPAKAPAAPGPAKQEPLIDFNKNPLGAFGLVLSSIAAGIKGEESPVEQLRKDQMERQAFEFKQAALAMDVVEKSSAFVSKLPAAQRADAIADLDARFSPALGGQSIAPFLTAITAGTEEQSAATMAALKELNPSPAMLAYFGKNPEAAAKFLNDYNTNKATKETPEEAAARAKAVTTATNEANATKPMTPAEIAADKRAREANAASYSNAKATRDAAEMQRGTSQENTLRNEFTTQSKNFVVIRDAKQKIDSAASNGAKDKTGAADMSLVFGYMKMLDPTSTVREGEYASAANSGGVGARIQGLYNKALEGKLLTETQRKDFVNNAKRIYEKSLNNQKDLANRYTTIAKQSGADPRNVIVDYSSVDDPLGLR